MKLKKTLSCLAVVGALGFAAVNPAVAGHAIVSFTGGTTFGGFSSDETVGFVFGTNANLTVTQLGWYSTDGNIDSSHQIGIWNSLGNLLGSTTISPGAPDGTGFRYASVASISLSSGQQYFIGGRDLTNDGDSYVTSVSNLLTDGSISFLGSAVSSSGSGFAFPSAVNNTTTGGRFGANFIFDVTPSTVPEPATLALLGLSLAGLGFSRRKKA